MELLDDPQANPLEATHDHVVAHLQAYRRLHVSMLSRPFQPQIAARLNVRDIADIRRLVLANVSYKMNSISW
jgi:hypothetical protein